MRAGRWRGPGHEPGEATEGATRAGPLHRFAVPLPHTSAGEGQRGPLLFCCLRGLRMERRGKQSRSAANKNVAALPAH